MEIWKTIKGFENYEISNFGNVRNKKNNFILKGIVSKRGYIIFGLVNKKVRKTKCLHRLLGIYFLNDGLDGDFVVDHIDNNKLNNNLDNLQITTKRINSTKDRKNLTGESCIYFSKSKNNTSYRVRVKQNKKRLSLGCYKTIEEAISVRNNFLKSIN